jgi:hypothetical protein
MADEFDPFRFLLELRDGLIQVQQQGDNNFADDITGLTKTLEWFAHEKPTLTSRLKDKELLEDLIKVRNGYAGLVEVEGEAEDYGWSVDVLSRLLNEHLGVEAYEMMDPELWKDPGKEDASPR